MQAVDTSNEDVPIKPDPKIDLISCLRKENLHLQTKVGELQAKLQKFNLLDAEYKDSTQKLKEANSEISDLKYRLQISINQNSETQNQLNIERYTQNKICANEFKKLKYNNKQILQQKNILSDENKKLKEENDSLSHKYDVDIAFIKNQDRILLSSASSFFKIEFGSIQQLQDYLFSHSLPPSILPEKDRQIDLQLTTINSLKSKCHSIKKEYESLLSQKQSEIDQQKQKIQDQNLIINDLNSKIEQKVEFFTKKISKIKSKIPKQKKLYKYTSPTIMIIPDSFQIPEKTKENENKAQKSKLIENLNETISQLQEENQKMHNESLNYQIQIQKLNSENTSKTNQITKYKTELKTLKKESEIKLQCANGQINELKLSSKIPDPFTEQLISSAKSKIRHQKDSIILKDTQLNKLTNEVNHLKLIISHQKIDIARLKAEIANQSDKSSHSIFAEIDQNSYLQHQEQHNININANSFVFNYSDLNPKLKPILRTIIENNSISFESKLQLSIQKVDSFYMAKIQKMKKFKEINYSIENFLSELFQLLIGRKVEIEKLAKNTEIQSQAIEALKEEKRKLETFQSSSLHHNNEISNLKRKLAKAKAKLASEIIQQKKCEALKSELESANCKNEKLKSENAEIERKNALLKNENEELYAVLERERNTIIQMKKEQSNSLGEYEELIKKMKKKCNDQRKTIKCLSGCNC